MATVESWANVDPMSQRRDIYVYSHRRMLLKEMNLAEYTSQELIEELEGRGYKVFKSVNPVNSSGGRFAKLELD
jgi:hypothetical protein